MLKKVIISAFAMFLITASQNVQAAAIIPQISNLHAREIAEDFLEGTAINSQFLSESNPPMFAVEMQTEDGANYTLYINAITANVIKMEIPPQIAAPQATAQEINFIWPVLGHYRISSGYGNRRNPITGTTEFHMGIDIPAPLGTAVLAARSGRVALSRWNGSGGYMVIISHGDGFVTRYAHNSELLVSAGQWVNQGDTIAKVGSTGMSTGPHLHFDITLNGVSVSPLLYVNP